MLGGKELLIILVIIILIFGTKKLKNLGSDLGSSVKGFKNAMKEGEEEAQTSSTEKDSQEQDKS